MMSGWSDLLRLFFPQCCLLCGKRLVPGEEYLCFRCLASLPRTHTELCAENEVERNLWGRLPAERACSFLYYVKGGDVRKLLYHLKYHGGAGLGHFLGRWMASELSVAGFFHGIDVILPVPLHPRKERLRGYNQSEKLAEGISQVTGIPLWKEALKKTSDTDTQTHMAAYERWMNVGKSFVCTSRRELEGKHVLLVDDVMTTGSTLVACGDTLMSIPGLKVSLLTFALSRGV